jgi:hypothetical protein
LQQEWLDYFVMFGQQHMDHLVSEMLAYYQEGRTHQSKGNDPLSASQGKSHKAEVKNEKSPANVVSASEIQCRQRLGGTAEALLSAGGVNQDLASIHQAIAEYGCAPFRRSAIK